MHRQVFHWNIKDLNGAAWDQNFICVTKLVGKSCITGTNFGISVLVVESCRCEFGTGEFVIHFTFSFAKHTTTIWLLYLSLRESVSDLLLAILLPVIAFGKKLFFFFLQITVVTVPLKFLRLFSYASFNTPKFASFESTLMTNFKTKLQFVQFRVLFVIRLKDLYKINQLHY